MPMFCKCGGLLVPEKKKKKTVLICRKCGKKYTKFKSKESQIFKTDVKKSESIILMERKKNVEGVLPTVKIECPVCKNKEAYYRVERTATGEEDEKMFRIYKCTKCGHVWRESE